MIIVVVSTEFNERTQAREQIVSHGFDTDTDRTVVLPQVSPRWMEGVRWDIEIGEYILESSTT